MTAPEHQVATVLAPVVYMNPIDRFGEFLDRLFDPLFGTAAAPVTRPKWWIVSSSTMTHLVITNRDRSIIIAPAVWHKYIGLNLDVLLAQHHAHAVPIPGPHPE